MPNPKIAEAGKATRFKPGNRANPGGRPRGLSIPALVREELAKPVAEGSGITNAQMLARRIVQFAVAGQPLFVKMAWEMVDGKPNQRLMIDVQAEAERIAAAYGVPPERVLSIVDELKRRGAGYR
jgi:hypothetical protein